MEPEMREGTKSDAESKIENSDYEDDVDPLPETPEKIVSKIK